MRRGLVLLITWVAACSPPAPAAIAAQVTCVPEGDVLQQRCTVRLTERGSGRPLAGATVTLTADMPSMPLAHSVAPVTATPTGEAGSYQGTLRLEMTGRWVVAVRIAGPASDQLTHPLDVGQ
jgi:hypothetical protein